MSKIYEIHPGWMSKSEIAYKLGVSERTIYARWKRGELLRKEIQGQVLWAELPEEGRKEAEEGPSVARFHAYPEGFGSRGSWPSDQERERPHFGNLIGVLEQKQRTITELEKENSELRISLSKNDDLLKILILEKDRLQRQNEAFMRVFNRPTLLQKMWLWIKKLVI